MSTFKYRTLALVSVALLVPLAAISCGSEQSGNATEAPAGETPQGIGPVCICGEACSPCNDPSVHETCIDGACCVSPEPNDSSPNLAWCGGPCVDLNFDDNNCGSCGTVCLPFKQDRGVIIYSTHCNLGRCTPACVATGSACGGSSACCSGVCLNETCQ